VAFFVILHESKTTRTADYEDSGRRQQTTTMDDDG